MKEGWKKEKFEDVFDLQMGKTPSRDNPSYWEGLQAHNIFGQGCVH